MTCPVCLGRGVVPGRDEPIACPNCGGTGRNVGPHLRNVRRAHTRNNRKRNRGGGR